MPQYKLASSAEADRLDADAATKSDHARASNDRANNYMLAVVLFATSLFFAGISTKLSTLRVRAAILGLGWAVFLAGLILLATFPRNFSG